MEVAKSNEFKPWPLDRLVREGVRIVVQDRVIYAQRLRSFKVGDITATTYIAHRDCGGFMKAGTCFTQFYYTIPKPGHQHTLFE